MTYTLGGKLLVSNSSLGTYPVDPDSGTLGSGQEFTSKVPIGNSGYPAVIFIHSAGGTAGDMLSAGPIDDITDLLCGFGFPCLGLEVHDESWDNTQSRADIDEGWAYAISDLDADDTQVCFLGLSMGGWASFGWASENLSSVLCIATIVGVANAQDFYDAGIGATQTSINAAYGGAPGWVSAQPTHDPYPLAQAGAFDGLNCRLWYGTSDGTGLGTTATEALATEIGASCTTRPNPGNHLTTTLNINRMEVASYIVGQYPPTARARTLIT